ncbi:hypothetical protein [Amycolatopsis pithecellobii]|uniref:DUF3558 domain-containing protein n=1 Tax=Amycolatopsis pithecellobii TaxID=664692 RepID=A0A6N7Z3E3_9PSEU|nr:hypothetical protein [Amycolatopsis pithecellobii]MTD56423.1 hypothetical protein [Amycolatopsis pithecellobii]
MRSKVAWCAALAVLGAVTATSCSTAVPGHPHGAPSGSTSTRGSAITVGTMHVTLLDGMRYTEAASPGGLDGCVSATSVPCVAQLRDLRTASAGPQFTAPSGNRPYGWQTGTDAPRCVTPMAIPGAAATGSSVVERGFAPIGPKKAEYARFQVTCEDPAQNSEVRMWWLPTSKILVVEYASTPVLDAQLDQVLATATFG